MGLLNDHEAEDVDHKLSTLPAFLRRSTALEFDFSLMQSKVAELEKVLRESAARPFFDDGEEGQRRKSVETLSKELETLAAKSHKRLREIREDVKSRRRKALEQELGENVLRHLTTTLRDVLEKFASVQGTHSKREFSKVFQLRLVYISATRSSTRLPWMISLRRRKISFQIPPLVGEIFKSPPWNRPLTSSFYCRHPFSRGEVQGVLLRLLR